MRSKSFTVGVDVVARCYFSINLCFLQSSCCGIIVAISPSLMIICSFYYRFCTFPSSSICSTKARRASLGELVYHFLERICCDLFSTVSFENLSSSCCNNTARILLLSVEGQHLLIYRAVPLTL